MKNLAIRRHKVTFGALYLDFSDKNRSGIAQIELPICWSNNSKLSPRLYSYMLTLITWICKFFLLQSNIQPEHIADILGPILAGLTGGVSVLTTAEVIRTSRILTRKRDKKRKKSFYLALFASGTIASFTGLQFYARSYF